MLKTSKEASVEAPVNEAEKPAADQVELPDNLKALEVESARLGSWSSFKNSIKQHNGTIISFLVSPDNRKVALKKLPLQNNNVGGALREIKVMAKLKGKHNTLKLWRFYLDKNEAGLILEYAGKGSLYRYLTKKGMPLNKTEVMLVFGQVISALVYMHSLGIVHRDIKPDNILLLPDNKAKLADFGLAKKTDETTKTCFGTLTFIPPESLLAGKWEDLGERYKQHVILTDEGYQEIKEGRVKASRDIYSFALTMLECMTNTCAFESAKASIAKSAEPLKTWLEYMLPENGKPEKAFSDEALGKATVHMRDTLLNCASFVPNKRPTASELQQESQPHFDMAKTKPSPW